MSGRLIRTALMVCMAGACPDARGETVESAESAEAKVELKDVSLDKPLVLDEFTDYHLKNVSVAGVRDCAAVTLAGRIRSVVMEQCSFGRVLAGPEGKAVGIECAGAMVGKLVAVDSTFFDAENQVALLKEGSFGRVRFERCKFNNSDSFLKQVYALNPWRGGPPTAEFYNIERLELIDNQFTNTTVVIHPSVKQVIVRGAMPGLRVQNGGATQVIHLREDQVAESIAPPAGEATVAGVDFAS